MRAPADAILLFTPLLSRLDHERVAVAYLSAEARLLGIATVAEGDDAAAALPGVEILREAVDRRATGLILAHNHPSGDARPSLADIRATRRLAAGADALGIVLLDHVVLATDDARSFRLMGLM
ncbi:JAB domain-containing protein [Sphingomonas sp.]|uniref:JAB domain-containing protein n=1 Tax=Sphingomonas sp. TaxID=28214 RepID=UPI003AFFB1A3